MGRNGGWRRRSTGSLRSRGRGPGCHWCPEVDPFLHRLHPMLSSAFGQEGLGHICSVFPPDKVSLYGHDWPEIP
ncbi:hypothetical protein STEG23_030220 [Scotinomys teguina]